MNDTTTASSARNPRRRKSRGKLIATMLVIVAAGGWYGVNKYLHRGDSEGEYLFSAVTTGDIEDLVTSTGTLQPRDFVDVGAQVSGQIQKIYVEIGDVVVAGQTLAEIDATTAVAKVDGLKAQLLSAETNLKTQITNRDKAKRDYQRQQNLLVEDATTKEAVMNAQTTYENAERQIIVSEAQIEQQKANMRIEEKNLGYTTIAAPISGTVMSIAVKQGQTVNATQSVPNVMRIANLSTMTIQSEVSEADVAKLYKGIPVYFTTLGGQNRRWYGELKRIEPTPKVQNSVVLYNALFDVQNEGTSLMPSMTAQVYFVSAEAKQVLMVPMAALQQGQQISRALAEKAKKEGKAAPGAAAKPADGATAGAATAAPATATAVAAREGAPAGAAVAANAEAPPSAGAPGRAAPGAPGQGVRPAGPPGGGAAAGGQRPGGAGGFPGGFNGGQNLTPEQQEQFRRMREQRQAGGGQGGQPGGFGQRGAGGAGAAGGAGGFGQRGAGAAGGGAGGFGQRGAGGAMAATGGGGGVTRQPQRRNGTVMVKLADGTLEARQVVVGVTNRVHGQVLSGLKEGEEVVVGKREKEPAPGTPNQNQNQNFNQGNRPNNQGGGFPGGGGNFRPF